jgi:citrate lyase subunit beta/citryl-CoA lyase
MMRAQSEFAAACRSYLFVPGNRPERFDKACAAGAGAVIIDLEDAVAPNEKFTARAAVRDWLCAEKVAAQSAHEPSDKAVLIRINSATTEWFAGDLALCNLPGVAGIVLPKAEYAAQVRMVADAGAAAILPLIESAQGFGQLAEITQQAQVQRLIFGSIDFQLDLGIDGEGEELLFFRSQLVLQSKLAGILSPVDGVSVGIEDSAQLRSDAQRARRLGFGAKLCIHPKQVEQVNRAFRPDAASVAWAARVIDAADAAGGAAVAVDGKMVDLPVLLKARAIRMEAEFLAELR